MRDGRFARLAYTTGLYVAVPGVLLYLLYRSIRQPGYRLRWGERFGRYRSARPTPIDVWIHAVSVGETRAAQPLIEALLESLPARRILLSHMTPTGHDVSIALFGDRVERVYLPYDFPAAVGRFLVQFRPAMGILMETEVWPNLVNACVRRGIPLALVNARLSEKSRRKAARLHWIIKPALASLATILAQSADDALRFKALGAGEVRVTGNLKFDIIPPRDQLMLGEEFRRLIGGRPVLLCASTREGEESLLLAALMHAHLPADTLIVIVPRHPQRFGEVEALIRNSGLAVQKRSDGGTISLSTRIWFGDSMGEMFAYYRAADIAYIGGGLLPFGSHNLIEACAVACPVLVGPHTHNFAAVASEAIAAGGALRVLNADDLMSTAAVLLNDSEARHRMAEHAEAFAVQHRGATQRTLSFLAALAPKG